MTLTKYRWEKSTSDQAKSRMLAKQCHLSPLLAQLLINRGYQDPVAVEAFLTPSPEDLHNPFLMHDMQKGVDRIQQAIMEGQKITIYGDYDVDGITSTAIMYEALSDLGADCDYYIPNRFKDGYGPNKAVYQQLIDQGTQLIVTVDNGVSGAEAVALAAKQGVDVVITDHHELPEQLPDAYAIIHPQLAGGDGPYPFSGLSGAGVAFKTVTALLEEVPQDALDLCALGAIADVMPLVDENRVLVKYGLEQLRHTSRLGLLALCQSCNLELDQIDEEKVGFVIAPNLNAIGRLDDASCAVELLTTLDESQAQTIAEKIKDTNEERKKLVDTISKQALEMAQDNQKPVNVIYHDNWHLGVLGIAANRVMENTGKPTILLTRTDEGLLKGSGRSIEAFNLFAAIDPHRDLLENFGGHHMACGLTLKAENMASFEEALAKEAQKQNLSQAPKTAKLVDAVISLKDITPEFIKSFDILKPFGLKNPKPIFAFKDYTVVDGKAIGDGSHLRLGLTTLDGQETINALDFGLDQDIEMVLKQVGQVEFIGSLSINIWQEKEYAQIIIEDLKINQTAVPSLTIMRPESLKKSMFQTKATYVFFTKEYFYQLKPYIAGQSVLVSRNLPAQTVKEAVLVDGPITKAQLKLCFDRITAEQYTVMFYHKQSFGSYHLPNRQIFAKVYRAVINLKAYPYQKLLDELTVKLQIEKNWLIFILQVFFEAGFVKMDNGSLSGVATAPAHKLEDTRIYCLKKQQLEMRQMLAAKSDEELKTWLLEYIKH